jgi:hypothetical protein
VTLQVVSPDFVVHDTAPYHNVLERAPSLKQPKGGHDKRAFFPLHTVF